MNKDEITKIAKTEEHMINLDKKVDQGFFDVKATLNSINEKFEDLERKFASKWVENAVSALIGLIVLSVVATLLAFVLRKPI